MRIEYIATRNLGPGHTINLTYEIAVLAQTLDRDVSASISRQVSLDRSRVESELRGIERFYDVTTDHIPIGNSSRYFEEFLESVINGESFTFDPDSDAVGSVVSPQSAILESSSYRPVRAIPGYYQYSFTVRLL
jgi:hypothetical protein